LASADPHGGAAQSGNFSSLRIAALLAEERNRFDATHPRSIELFAQGQEYYLYGAPSHWMRRWIGGSPLYIHSAAGAHLVDVDGHQYVDFCLGDTGGMCGHGHPAITRAVARQLEQGGASMMLPTQDALWVGEELQRRFGLRYWNLATSASDANRSCIRLSRMITGREKVLVFSGCYHGAVEEAHVELRDGEVRLRNNIHPNGFDHARLSKVVEFNDIEALAKALADRDVACVLTEPVMTNYGMIAPEPGFLEELRRLTRATGTLLIMDETHTISSGTGGYSAAHGLEPDMFVVGKAIAGGIPAAAYGVTQPVADRIWEVMPKVSPLVRQSAHGGFGGTLAGNAVTVAAIRAVLEHVLSAAAFENMISLAGELAQSARRVISLARLPWHVMQVGARIEYMFSEQPPRNASEFRAVRNAELEGLLHLFFLNRGVLITPFHNMLLMCPATTRADVRRQSAVFEEFVAMLM
jgi:glutamate-1-semialdehyde 2,1-aminomutase